MWEISLTQQALSILYALLIGAVWAFYSDLFRAFRCVTAHSGILTFIEDLFSFLLFTFITFMLLMARCNGEVRGYMLVGEGLGFLIFRVTVSRFVMKILTFLFGTIADVLRKSGAQIERFGGFLEENTGKLWLKIKKIFKKFKVKQKNS